MSSSFVYVIGPTTNPVKIGFAEDVAVRLVTLQIGCPDELIIHKAIAVPRRIADLVERAVHQELAAKRRRGEWFNIEAEEAIEVVREIAEHLTASYLESMQSSDRDRDLLERLGKRVALHKFAREAVDFYLSELKVRKDAKAVKAMNAFMLQRSSLPGLELFKRAVIANTSVEYFLHNDQKAVEKAYEILGAAVNALAEYYVYRKNRLSTVSRADMPPALRTAKLAVQAARAERAA